MVSRPNQGIVPLSPSSPKKRGQRPMEIIRAGFDFGSRMSPELAARVAKYFFIRPRKLPASPWEAEILEAADERIVLKNGLVGARWGHGPKKILLVHGWEGRASQMGRLVPALVEAGHQVFAFDGPAHGASPGNTANPSMYADALVAIGKEVGPFEVVVAHSFGGVATGIGIPRGLPTKKVVLLASPSNPELVTRRFADWVGLRQTSVPSLLALLEQHVGIAPRELSLARLGSKIDQPTLVLHDPEDDEVPFQDAVSISKHWAKAELIPLSGVGHRRILKDPEVVRRILAFVGYAPDDGA